MSVFKSWMSVSIAALVAVCVAGCSKSDKPSGTAADSKAGALPAAAISAIDDDADDDDPSDPDDEKTEAADLAAPKEGTPEWLVHEATRLLVAPPPQTEDVEVLKKHRKEKNDKIIELSQAAIKQTHADKEKERLFNLAVHNLLEARLQLALSGDRDSIDSLYEDAAALFKRDPKSAAAAEGANTLVNMAYTLARNSSGGDLDWIGEFARQARHFAVSFPAEERRALPLLFTAGRSCELSGLTIEALECYTLIQKGFPKSQYAASVAPILRRLKLPGSPPQLGGPTIDGDHVALDDLLGKVVLVVFWSTEARPFQDQLRDLVKVTRKQARRGVVVVGVNLDQEPAVVKDFVVQHRIPWPQIFFPETEKRGWNNPIVNYYGIMDIPALWLIDPSGNVVSTNIKIESLAEEISKLLVPPAAESGTPSASKPPADQ